MLIFCFKYFSFFFTLHQCFLYFLLTFRLDLEFTLWFKTQRWGVLRALQLYESEWRNVAQQGHTTLNLPGLCKILLSWIDGQHHTWCLNRPRPLPGLYAPPRGHNLCGFSSNVDFSSICVMSRSHAFVFCAVGCIFSAFIICFKTSHLCQLGRVFWGQSCFITTHRWDVFFYSSFYWMLGSHAS